MNSKSLKSGFGIGSLIFIAAAVIALPVRTLQFFTVLESGTGFYSENDWSVMLLSAVAAAAVIAILIYGIINRKKLDYSLEQTKRPGFGILSLTAAVGALADSAKCMLSVTDSSSASAESEGAVGFIFLLQAVFALLSAIYFASLGLSCLSGKSGGREYKIISLAPVLWSIFRLVFRFTRTISYLRVSDLMFEMLMLVFMIMFFFAFAQVNSQINAKGKEWKIASYGLPAALFALICFVPRFIVTLSGNTQLLCENSPVEYCDIAVALFIISAVFTRVTDKLPEQSETTTPEE